MSLPGGFDSADAYFASATEFLRSYAWIYQEANTACLRAGVLDRMPKQFQDYFLRLPQEQLNAFPFVHEELSVHHEAVQQYRQQLAQLTPIWNTASSWKTPAKPRRKMAPKKQHEIDALADHIHAHCVDTPLLVDLGAGLGYLSEALLELSPDYRVLGLEADEQRVEAARQRLRQLLPPTAAKSISYQQAYIEEGSGELIEREISALDEEHSKSMALIGLHACADLSISALRLFLSMPRVRRLHIMPCCYHKMALSTTPGRFINFPLSAALRGVLEAANWDWADCFNRPFLRLACQQTSARWRQCSALDHAQHGRQMYARALAEGLINVDQELVKPVTKRVKSQPEEPLSFAELRQSYELRSRETGKLVEWRTEHEDRCKVICERYGDERGPRLAEALTCLQTAMQKLCENLVLYDRLCHLEETAAAQQLRLAARYEKLLDEKLSPRCFVLIAEKLTT